MKPGEEKPCDPVLTAIERLQQLLERKDITPYERARYEADLQRLLRSLPATADKSRKL